MELAPDELDSGTSYRIISSVVVPRPIGWISTRSDAGVDNLAPYSYFNAVSSDPMVVMFSAGGTGEDRKHTPQHAIERGEFVWNLASEPLIKAMDDTSASIPPSESEFEFAGIDRAPSVTVEPPRVADTPVSFECRVYDSFDVYENTVVLGEVVYVHLDDALLTDGKVDTRTVDAVARLGGPYYSDADPLEFERQY